MKKIIKFQIIEKKYFIIISDVFNFNNQIYVNIILIKILKKIKILFELIVI